MNHWSIRANGDDGTMELSHQGQVDEISIGSWFHLEQMDRLVVWMRVGDARVTVELRPASRPVVDIDRGARGEMRGTTSVGAPIAAPKTQDTKVCERVVDVEGACNGIGARCSWRQPLRSGRPSRSCQDAGTGVALTW